MSRIGKIVLANNIKDPLVIISENPYNYKGITLTKEVQDGFYYSVKDEDITKFDSYHGKKLENRSAFLDNYVTISKLRIREIGAFTDKGYFNLLKNYVGNQASMGGKDSSYLLIRNDVHNQLVKMMQKK